MLKRLCTLVLAVSLSVGVPAQVLPHETAMPSAGGQVAMGMDEAAQQTPQPDRTSHCGCCGCKCSLDLMGLVCAAAPLPTPASPFVSWTWAAISYPSVDITFRGQSVKPELFPPILVA